MAAPEKNITMHSRSNKESVINKAENTRLFSVFHLTVLTTWTDFMRHSVDHKYPYTSFVFKAKE